MTQHDVSDFMAKHKGNHLAGKFHVLRIVFLDKILGEPLVELINLGRVDSIPFFAIRFNLCKDIPEKQYSLDANDLVHLPYVHFGTLVSNFNPEGGASFNSYMVLCLHGYIKKFISEDALVYVNPAKKVTLSYVETTKTGKDGEVIEYLHSIEPFDADSQGKLQFASKMYETLTPEMQDMYGYLVTTESPKHATDIYAEAHNCSKERAVLLLTRMRRKIRLEWSAKHLTTGGTHELCKR